MAITAPTTPTHAVEKGELNRQLAFQAKEGDKEAMALLISSNAAFIWKMAKKFFGLCEPEDLFQAGAIGLMKAVEKYDGSNGFLTYAGHWVRLEMQMLSIYNSTQTAVKVPKYLYDDLRRMTNCGVQSADGMAEHGWSAARIRRVARASAGMKKASLDAPSGMKGNIGSTLQAKGRSTTELADSALVATTLTVILLGLPEKMGSILFSHYGEGLSFAEIAKESGCTRERVRVVHNNAINAIVNAKPVGTYHHPAKTISYEMAEELRIGILGYLAKEYRKKPKKRDEIEFFLLSDWGETLSYNLSKVILLKLEEEVGAA